MREGLQYISHTREAAQSMMPAFPAASTLLQGIGDALAARQATEHSFVAFTDGQDRNIAPSAFNETFGTEIANELRRIGCTQVTTNGDRVSLALRNEHFEPVGQGGIERVRLGRNVSFDMTRNGNEISISNVSGVDLDFGRFTPWVGVPNVTLTRDGVSVLGIPIPVGSEPYDNVSAMLRRLGR